MLPHHELILRELDERTWPFGECCVGFKPLISASGMERQTVRRIVRHLARKGLAEYHRGLWTEEGEFAGSGYCITPEGRAALSEATVCED